MVWDRIQAIGKVDGGGQDQAVGASFVLATVAGWGHVGVAANIWTLDAMIGATSRHIDCAAIAGLSDSYVEAMGKSLPSGAKWVPHLLRTRRTYEQQLECLDSVLAAAGLRLLLVIEDLDRVRFRTDDARDRLAERLGRIEALLDKVKRLDRVSFIVAVGSSFGLD